MTDNNNFEAIIIGGSYSGLSAAMALGRSLRKVLVMDSGKPCNRQTPHSHNFLTQDGKTPHEITTAARQQVAKYATIQFHDGFAASGSKTASGFEITTGEGEIFTAQKLVFATGITDLMPEIKGFAECWGITIVHCPYCHGYEARNTKTAILANGERAFHLASLVSNLTREITVLTSGKPDFTSEQLEKLERNNIKIVDAEVAEIEHEKGILTNVIFKDGSKTDFETMYASIPFRQHSEIPFSFGCEMTETGHIKVDMFQKTSVDGIFACGDNTNMMRSVAYAVSAGNITGAMVNAMLTQEKF